MNSLREQNPSGESAVAALPPHSAEKLRLSVIEFPPARGYASKTRGIASRISGQSSRIGKAFPRCAAAKPLSYGFALVLAMFVFASFVNGQSKTTSKVSTTTDPTVTITLVRWPYT